jgi:hypothetical protein
LNKLRAFLVLILGSAILGCATTGSDSSGASAASAAHDTQHQILVMVQMPPPHFRPKAVYAGGYDEESGRIARRRIAARLAREHGLKLDNDWPMPVLGLHCFVMEVPGKASPEHIAEILAHDPRVEWAQPVHLFHAMGRADPLYSLQPDAALWHLAEIHQAATGRNVRVAIVDSGIEAEHPDLAGQVELKENLVDGNPYAAETHGTAVAGIIAALAGNGIGIAGIAPDARLLAMRACWEESRDVTNCNSFTLGKALHSAIMHGAQVINLSLTGPSDRLLRRLLDAALARGIKLVGAVDPHSKDGGFPASHPGVLAVADDDSAAAAVGGMHMLIAPGRDIPTTVPGARWNFVSGPSFAAAHVSGLVALITELQPALAPALIQRAMGVDPAGIPAARAVDACATFARLAGICSCSCTALHATPNAYP